MKSTNKSKNRLVPMAALLLLAIMCFYTYKFHNEVNYKRVIPQHSANFKPGVLQYPGILSAIAYTSQADSLIILDGKFASENDTVNGFKITRILPQKVELEKDGQIWVATISQTPAYVKPDFNTSLPQTSSYRNTYRSTLPLNYTYSKHYTNSRPLTAENGSYYGEISKNTGRPKTVHVRGYYRKDGTYVRSHYRSQPNR